MRILIYSCNYHPEPIGIAPLMTELAEGLDVPRSFFNNAPGIHDRYAVTDFGHHTQVVGNQHDRGPGFILKAQH